MTTPVTVGVIGCGYWGPNLVRNFRALPGARVKVVCDLSDARLKHVGSLYPEIKTTNSVDEVMADSDINAVVVATPVHLHYELAKASLSAGKHTFIEKPMASSLAECQELVALAEEKDLRLMVGHTFLFSPSVRKIKEIVDGGQIGKLLYIASRRLNLGLFQKDINVVWDLAPHDISIILYLMGRQPTSVSCRGSANITPGIEDVANMALKFDGSGYAAVHNSWLDPRKVREMTIVGTKRMIVYDDIEPLQKLRIYDARVEAPPHYDTFAEFHYSYHYGDMYAPHIDQDEPLRVECQHFVDCIGSGQTPVSCGEMGASLVGILEGASQSLKQGGASVPLQETATV